MRVPVDFAVNSRTIRLTLVAIVEPVQLVSRLLRKAQSYCILVSAILVCGSSRLNDMRRRRFPDAQIEQWGDDGGVHDIPRVNERFRGGIGELGEAGDGLLGGDEGADRVDVKILVEVGQLEGKRVVGRVGGHGTGFIYSTSETNRFQGRDTHHCKRQHLGHLGLP